MKLTGQCKEQFEEWYITKRLNHSEDYFNSKDVVTIQYKLSDLKSFYIKHPSEKYGVYVDFFDSLGMHIEDIRDVPKFGFQIFKLDNIKPLKSIGGYSRPEARIAAIEKANEIFNNQNK